MSERLFHVAPEPLVVEPDEREFQRQVIELARLLGWKVAHFRPARTKHAWVTPVAADGKGFPDLILVRERVIAAELKSAKGKVTEAQQEWLDAFARAGVQAFVWKPPMLDEIAAELQRVERRAA